MITDKTLLFILTSYVIGSIPGPSVWFTVSFSLQHGVFQTLFTVLGQITGNFIYITLLLFGMATFISDNYTMISVLKYLGAAYLLYLGIRLYLSDDKFQDERIQQKIKSKWKSFGEGLIVCLSNPKLFLYFAAFLPQFVVVGNEEFLQLLTLGLLSLPIGFSILWVYAYAAVQFQKTIRGSAVEKYLNKFSALLISLSALFILIYN